MEKKRTLEESARVVCNTICEVKKVIDALPILIENGIIDKASKTDIINGTIEKACQKYKVNEKHIRMVAGWKEQDYSK